MPVPALRTLDQLPDVGLTAAGILDFCKANNVRFHALGGPEDWADDSVFRVATQESPARGITVAYQTVRNWHQAMAAMGERVLKGGRYRHYKGGEYETVGAAVLEEGCIPAVLYQGHDGTVWVRKQSNFFELVALGEGQFVPRFAYVGGAAESVAAAH